MTAHALRADAAAPVYPNDLTPALQETLAILADLDFAHEAAHERLAHWDGPEAVKREIARDLDARHDAAKAPYERRLVALRERAHTTSRLAAVG
ncbi:hypothetical protein GCM10011322_38820 [Salinarimonas ramus]|uniref:Uncharacterized protein n=2 Tax=Salinarimonas ramus TaxID=690164 RepID=A0A917QFA0_9HYPH|nr:hypothetical protein GCM10011322_38820 [Salinarimonas ramus]